jgi:UDP-N-acetylmuramyl pentapeptide phosphotransferase/UDP-N-acetylglucosamine-1-phosphate transferase
MMTSMRAARRLLMAASGARAAYAALTAAQPGGEKMWTRTNHRGEQVTLLEGPAVTIGAVGAALATPGLDARTRLALGLAGAGAGAFGLHDDLGGSSDRRGFRGHLAALAKGEVTTGAVKIVGIGVAGVAASFLLDCRDNGKGSAGPQASALGRATDITVNAGLVAGSANLLNLFDLRPGRATKVSLLSSLALGLHGPRARAEVAAPAGAVAALLPDDLAERAMLGDSGANAIGAMVGVAAASSLSRPTRVAILAAIAALTAASEKVSFTKVIARTPALHWLDMLGRRPSEPQVRARAAGLQEPASGPPNRVPGNGRPVDRDGDRTPAAEIPRPP